MDGSNPGGSDAGVIVAWEVSLNLTRTFDDLLDFDLLGEIESILDLIYQELTL